MQYFPILCCHGYSRCLFPSLSVREMESVKGRPDLGYWCNTEPANAALTSKPQNIFSNMHLSLLDWNEGEEHDVKIQQNDPQRDWISEQQAEKD